MFPHKLGKTVLIQTATSFKAKDVYIHAIVCGVRRPRVEKNEENSRDFAQINDMGLEELNNNVKGASTLG